MDDIISNLLSAITTGGQSSLIAVMIIVIAALGWYCYRLMQQLEKKDEKIYKIIDDYSKNNLTIAEALNSLKMVLIEIKAKL